MKEKTKTRQINFRVPEDVAELFERKAKATRLSLATWLMMLGLHASGKNELAAQLQNIPVRRRRQRRPKAERSIALRATR